MNVVFKVQLNRPPADDGKRQFHNRRPHTKSRKGCEPCKRRRVKCDELKPACNKCSEKGIACSYNDASPGYAAPNADAHNMSVSVVESHMARVLHGSPEHSYKALQDYLHFTETTSFQLGFIESQWILAAVVSETAWRHSYMMHMVLAVANSHFRRLYKDHDDPALHTQLVVDEAAHWQLALKQYRQELVAFKKDPKSYKGSPDGVMTAAFFSVVFAFAAEDVIASDIFLANNEAAILSAVNPLASTNAFLALMSVLPQFKTESAWSFLLTSSEDKKLFDGSQEPGVDGLPPAFVNLFGLTQESTVADPWHRMLRRLAPILRLRSWVFHMPKYFSFMGMFWHVLQPYVMAREPRALILLAWWFAMTMPVKLWWVNTRARTLIEAINRYLVTFENPKLNRFLEYPLSFGYGDKDWIWQPE